MPSGESRTVSGSRGRVSAAVTHIAPSGKWAPLQARVLWAYRDLLYFLVWRDLKVRYRQTVMGVSWAIIQPFLTMLIFSLFFGRLIGVPTGGTPYPIFAFTGLVPWTFFANAVTQASASLVGGAEMIKKIYFPRLVMPTASVLAGLVDLVLAFLVLLGMMVYYGVAPSARMLWLPVFALQATAIALGTGYWLSALNVQFRDVRYIVPFLVQAWFYSTPVTYPSSLLPGPWRTVYGINPMAGVVEGFRWALLGGSEGPGSMTIVSAAVTLLILVTGAFYFRRMERVFADVV